MFFMEAVQDNIFGSLFEPLKEDLAVKGYAGDVLPFLAHCSPGNAETRGLKTLKCSYFSSDCHFLLNVKLENRFLFKGFSYF